MKRHRIYEQTLTDFVHADDTDDACLRLIENIRIMQGYSPGFSEKARDAFPFLGAYAAMPKNEMQLFDLFYEEQRLFSKVGGTLAYLMAELISYDPDKQTLTYSLAPPIGPMNSKGLDFSEPKAESIRSLEERLMKELGLLGDIYPEYKDWKFREADALVAVGKNIGDLKQTLGDSRYEELRGLSAVYSEIRSGHQQIQEHQTNLKTVLRDVKEGKKCDRAEDIENILKDYNRSCKVEARMNLQGCVYNEMLFPDEESFIHLNVTRGGNGDPWFEPYLLATIFCVVEFLRVVNFSH